MQGSPYVNFVSEKLDVINRTYRFHDKKEKMKFDISYEWNIHGLLNDFHSKRKEVETKLEKTVQHTDFLIKKAEDEIGSVKMPAKRNVLALRNRFFFEKFYWFVSSDNFLVLLGRDSRQNEILVSRYLTHYDLFIHTDDAGCPATVIKNPSQEPIPHSTIVEAATYCMARTRAWEAETYGKAYYVNSWQVSKTAPTGQFISSGSFMIRGKRNYIDIPGLDLGVTFAFIISDDSIISHILDRRKFGEGVVIEAEPEPLTSTEVIQVDVKEEEPQQEVVNEESSEPVADKKYLSRKERRRKKRAKKLGISLDELEIMEEQEQEHREQAKAKKQQRQRNDGKRHKRSKKRRNEDADEDEDAHIAQLELELKQAALEVAMEEEGMEAEEVAAAIAAVQIEEQEHQEEPAKADITFIEERIDKLCFNCGLPGHEVSECPEPNFVQTRKQGQMDLDNSIEGQLAALDLPEGADVQKLLDSISIIDRLIFNPKPTDEIMAIIPMVGPWDAVRSSEFRVKLTHGSLKMGNAIKIVRQHMFEQIIEDLPAGEDFLSCITDFEWHNVMIGSVRVHGVQYKEKKKRHAPKNAKKKKKKRRR
ncbi:hypothetical protein PCE1_002459 [Barthelona sp. PCE]